MTTSDQLKTDVRGLVDRITRFLQADERDLGGAERLLSASSQLINELGSDRTAAWRYARAAADGHDHNREILRALAEKLHVDTDFEALPAALEKFKRDEAQSWKASLTTVQKERDTYMADRKTLQDHAFEEGRKRMEIQAQLQEANERIDEMKHALATSTRERERMQWNIGNLRAVLKAVAGPVMVYRDVSVHKMTFEQILQRAQQLADDTKQIIEYHSGEFIVMAAPGKRGTASTSAKPELVDIGLGDNRDAVKQGAHVWVRRPSARWDESAAWKLERRPEGSEAQLHPELDAGSANFIADAPGTYIVSGTWQEERAITVVTVDLHVPDEVGLQPVAVGEGTEHRQTLTHLHSTLAVADMMRAALLLAGAPEKGDLTAWASNVRNTIVGLKRDLHEAGQRFLAADSARRSELAEMSAACSNLPFLITPRDLSPIGLLLALRDAALRLHAAAVNPAAPTPVSGA